MDPEIVDAPDAVALDRGDDARRASDSGTCRSAIPPRPCRRRRGAARSRRGRADARPRTSLPPTSADQRRSPFRLDSIDFEVEPGQLVALVGPSGVGQDDDDLPRAAAVRRRRGRGRDRRPRRPVGDAGEPRRRDRLRDPGDVPVPRHDPGEPALREARRDRGRARGRDAGRGDPRPDRASFPTATTRSSASAATSCRAARSSGSRSRASC